MGAAGRPSGGALATRERPGSTPGQEGPFFPPLAELAILEDDADLDYLETSVPNFLFCTDASDKRGPTETLFRQIQAGRHQACVSALYFREVSAVSSRLLRYGLEGLPEVYELDIVPVTEGAEELVKAYIQADAFTIKNRNDALHVAVAARAGCDLVVSWNFRHIVRAWTMKRVAEVHSKLGLEPLVLCTPMEVIEGD